jgi:sporulation protein YlmC with PRC-barrel domain
MKNVTSIIATMLIFACMATGAMAQAKKVQKVSDMGVLTNEAGVKVGTIENGVLKNDKGVVIGKVVKNPKDENMFDFFDKDGRAIASVSKDGKVKDTEGKIIYTLSAPDANGYCTVYDANGVEFGKVHEKHKHTGACMMHASKKK